MKVIVSVERPSDHGVTAPQPPRRGGWRQALPWVALAALLAAFVVFEATALDPGFWKYDEGLNVIKAQLVREGYWPHRDIWSDQPPLFTLLLAVVQSALGPSLPVGRAFVLCWAVVLLVATFWLGTKHGSRWAALAAILLLAASPLVQELGRTILIGLPAVALGMLALGCALLAQERGRLRWLVIAGLLFGLGMLIKPLIAPYYPVLLLIAIWPARPAKAGEAGYARRWRRLLALHIAPAVLLLVATLLFGPRSFFGQVVGTFADARESYGFSLSGNLAGMVALLGSAYYPGLIVAAVISLVLLWRRRRERFWVMLAWTGISGAALLLHTPQRAHEYLLVLPPLCILAAIMPELVWRRARSLRMASRIALYALAVVPIVLAALGAPATVEQSLREHGEPLRQGREAQQTQLALNLLRDEVAPGGLVITDDPMLAYLTGHSVPPQLAVPSQRRLRSGNIAARELIELAARPDVQAVLFWQQRFTIVPEFAEWARTHLALRAVTPTRWFYLPVRPTWPQEACSDAGLCLVGSSARSLAVDPGAAASLTLFWRADRDIPTRYTLFAHLVDGEGKRWGQADIVPFQQTDLWRSGDLVALPVDIPIIAAAPVGPLYLSVGWYDRAGDRVSFIAPDGQDLPGGQITLTPRPAVRGASLNVVPSPDSGGGRHARPHGAAAGVRLGLSRRWRG